MLGSASEADDAVQEAWLRLDRADTSGVDNLGGWLTMGRSPNRPLRDRAIVHLLLGTGLRRAELVALDLVQLEPNPPEGLAIPQTIRGTP